MGKKYLPSLWLTLLAAGICAAAAAYGGRAWAAASVLLALLACLPFFLRFERSRPSPETVTLIAVMTAAGVMGRVIFAPVPGFKPVSAAAAICGMYFGPSAGFMCGALSAAASNMFFGQGPWTPFQMLAWGVCGLLAGLLSAPLRRSRLLLCVYGVFSGVLFSFIMDIWTALSLDGYLTLRRWLALTAAALPFTVMYAVGNVVFLLLLARPLGRKLARIKQKYGL